MKKPTSQMIAVLGLLAEMSLFRSGPRKGQFKTRVELDSWIDNRSLIALLRRDMIDYNCLTVTTGYALTAVGREALNLA